MKLSIKNMVCPRCIITVREILTSLGYALADVKLGYAELELSELSAAQLSEINDKLMEVGFELLVDNDYVTVERIKLAVIYFARIEGGLTLKLSTALEQKLGQSYKQMTATFSKIEGRTIENYFISQRIEYVKELISYGDLSLAEISYKTGYSSVAYLSKQFSQVVGMTVSEYRRLAIDMRESLTDV